MTLLATIWDKHEETVQAELTHDPASAPTFLEFLSQVSIESDPDEGGTGGPIPFKLYDYQKERAEAWQSGRNETILKPRQIGFSWLGASYAYWTAAYHQSAHVALFSAGELEVKKFMYKVGYIHDHLVLKPHGTIGVMWATFTGASTITGYPATAKAGIGTTLKLAMFDEAAFHPMLKENQGAVVPALGSFGQLIIMSTADPSLGPGGHFHDFFFASREGKTNCDAVFLPADCRPGRDDAWFANERSKFAGDEERFRAFYPFVAEEAFLGRTGLVFGFDHFGVAKFERLRNVRGAPCVWGEAKWRVAGVDPGGSDPNAIVAVGVSRDERFHVYGEFGGTGLWPATRFTDYLFGLDKAGRLNAVVVDPSAKLSATFEAMGLPARPANNDKGLRLSLLAELFLEGRLTIDPRCTGLLMELESYWYEERKGDQQGTNAVKTRSGHGHHADKIDALGYAIVAIVQGLPSDWETVKTEWR